jgi:hypothetical protein
MKPSGEWRHSRPDIPNHNLGDRELGKLTLNYEPNCASLNRPRSKLMPIDLLPGHTEEQRPRLHLATVIGKLRNLGGAVTNDAGFPGIAHDFIKSHGGDSR